MPRGGRLHSRAIFLPLQLIYGAVRGVSGRLHDVHRHDLHQPVALSTHVQYGADPVIGADVFVGAVDSGGDAAGFTPVWADEIALMTSGTTGTPKLVLYDGAAITAQLLQSESIVRKCPEVKHDRLARELRMLAFLPFYHISA